MIAYTEVFDITVLVGVESVDYPGDPPYRRRTIGSLADGGVADVSFLEISAHHGTHIDTPAHFIPGGANLDAYRAEDFILPARVIDVGDAPLIEPEALAGAGVRPGEGVLFKTRNSASGRAVSGRFYDDGVALSPAAAAACVEAGVRLVGLDYFSVDPTGRGGFPVHHALLASGVLVLETLNLRDVPAGGYTLICLPLKLDGCEASPVRAVLLR